MDLLSTQGAQLAPKDTPEAIAIFRARVIGPLLTRAFVSHGDLADAIRALSRQRHRPPTSDTSRTYSEATIERWYSTARSGWSMRILGAWAAQATEAESTSDTTPCVTSRENILAILLDELLERVHRLVERVLEESVLRMSQR